MMSEFPELDRKTLSQLKKFLDNTFRDFSETWGESFENFFSPVLYSLNLFESLLLSIPYYILVPLVGAIIYYFSRAKWLSAFAMIALFLMGYFAMWEETVSTISIVSVSTTLCIVIGIPLGILAYKKPLAEKIITPILDIAQTIPSFVYLIPVIMLFGLGKVPGIIAICVFAMPPVIRFTTLGLKEVDRELVEVGEAFGMNWWQALWTIELPLAKPTIYGGINQTVMMCLSMVVVASLIGVQSLGSLVWQAVYNQYIGLGLMSGLAICALAIIIDRTFMYYNKRTDWKTKNKR
jgi:glycine betaine/proline transport system permease protein